MLELLEIERHQRHQSIGVRGRKSVEVLFNLHFPLCTSHFALFHPQIVALHFSLRILCKLKTAKWSSMAA